MAVPKCCSYRLIVGASCNSSPGGKVLRSSCSSVRNSRGLRQKSWSKTRLGSYTLGIRPDLGFCRRYHRKLLIRPGIGVWYGNLSVPTRVFDTELGSHRIVSVALA